MISQKSYFSEASLEKRLERCRSLVASVGRQVEALHADARQTVTKKGMQDFVTFADRQAEATIREVLKTNFPDDGFLGEENGYQGAGRGTWVVDPIDGTTNYIRGDRNWAVSIAFVQGDQIELGCIYEAVNGKVWYARRGEGAYCDGQLVSPSFRTNAQESLAILGNSRRTDFGPYLKLLECLHLAGMDHRVIGSAAVGLLRVAGGSAELFFEAHLNSWDVMAAALIASEAGALVKMPSVSKMRESGGPVAAYSPGVANILDVLIHGEF